MNVKTGTGRWIRQWVWVLAAWTSIASGQSVQSAGELVEFYDKVWQQSEEPALQKPATRGIDGDRGIAGIRQGGAGSSGNVANPVATGSGNGPGNGSAASGKGVDFHNIVFDSGSYAIQPDAYLQLDEIGTALSLLSRRFPQIRFTIEGHTDSLGDPDSNRELSFNRANAIRRYLLVKHAIAPSHLEAVGMGESQPMASNSTRQGRALNRRVSIQGNRNP